MITGRVNAAIEAVVPIILRDSTGGFHHLEAVVDTGFSDDLTLSIDVINALKLQLISQKKALLSDGTMAAFDFYLGHILWMGQILPIDVEVVEGPSLLGMRVISGCDLRIEAIPGGTVSIAPLPTP